MIDIIESSHVTRMRRRRLVSLPVDNLIALFSSAPDSPWKVCNGVADSLDLIGMYLRGGSSEGSPAGSNTHEHASEPMQTGGFTNAALTNSWIAGVNVNYTDRYHSHDMSHGHDAVNNEPLHYQMIPAVGTGNLPADTLLFFDGPTAPAGWTAWVTVYDKMIKCAASAGAPGGAASHEHVFEGQSGGNSDQRLYKYTASYPLACYTVDHTHSIDHIHSGGNNYPEWRGLLPVRCDAITAKSAIPSGMVAHFKGDIVPAGWTQYVLLNGKFIQCRETNGETGGADTHGHAHSGYTGIYYEAGQPMGASYGFYAIQDDHSHTMTATQHAAVSNVPYHRPLLVCKKD